MKITLTYEEAVAYIAACDDFNHFAEDVDIVIEGIPSATETKKETTSSEDTPATKPRRKRRTKKTTPPVEESTVTQDDVNNIVSEVDAELEANKDSSVEASNKESVGNSSVADEDTSSKPKVTRTAAEEQQLNLIDEVLAEEPEALEVEVPLVEQPTAPEILDLDKPLFG